MNKNKFMNDRVRDEFGHIEVYNPNKKEIKEIKKYLANEQEKLNTRVVELIKEKREEMGDEIETNEFFEIVKIVSQEMSEESRNNINYKFGKMLTNIPEEILLDEEVWDLPSDDLQDAMDEVDRIIGRFVKKQSEKYGELITTALTKKG